MRVGVHTGTVLCGIVGTVRFKFDVWSNDVTMANIMESSGEPGKVHISESTRSFIVDEYDMTEGEEVAGRFTLFNSICIFHFYYFKVCLCVIVILGSPVL